MTIGWTYDNSCPEAPDITVNSTTVDVDDTTALWVDEHFHIADSTGGLGLAFTLSQSPYSNAAVFVFKSGSAGLVTTDYTLSDTALTLTTALQSDEILHVKYMSTETT